MEGKAEEARIQGEGHSGKNLPKKGHSKHVHGVSETILFMTLRFHSQTEQLLWTNELERNLLDEQSWRHLRDPASNLAIVFLRT